MLSSASIEILDSAASVLFVPGFALERLATGATWCEGPVWMPRDQCLLYSDIPANRMMRWSPADGLTVWRENVEFTNGHTLDHEGNLLHCSHGQRAITRTRFGAKGVLGVCEDEIVVDRFEGGRLNSPNDLVVRSDGTIWFTDPPYGILSNREGHQAPFEQSANHVFCYDPKTGVLHSASTWVQEPNGLAFSKDEKTLYVSDTSAALKPEGNHHIVQFTVDGFRLSAPRIFAVISPGLSDGFRVDSRGWIFTSSEDSVQVLSAEGRLLAKICVPEKVGNLCFGDTRPEGQYLYICASTSLYRILLRAKP